MLPNRTRPKIQQIQANTDGDGLYQMARVALPASGVHKACKVHPDKRKQEYAVQDVCVVKIKFKE